MVADVSGSMDGAPLAEAKNIMINFINSVQFDAGDLVELTSFSTGVRLEQEFCDDPNVLTNDINALYTDDMTSLYDALYTAVERVATQTGARCVIAFTDGNDNYSNCTLRMSSMWLSVTIFRSLSSALVRLIPMIQARLQLRLAELIIISTLLTLCRIFMMKSIRWKKRTLHL